MSSGQNPFADREGNEEPISAEIVQPTPAAENPYTSPREMSQRIPDPIGLWRDGKFVVAHRDSIFPAVCIRTNEPAQRKIRCRLLWSYPIDIARRRANFDVGLCDNCVRRIGRIRVAGWLAIISGVMLVVLVNQVTGPRFIVTQMVAAFAVLFLGIFLAGRPGVVLSIKRVRGPYFWIRGAHHGFLDQLPPWQTDLGS